MTKVTDDMSSPHPHKEKAQKVIDKILREEDATAEELQYLALAYLQSERVAEAAAGSDVAIRRLVYDPMSGFDLRVDHWGARILAEHFYQVIEECEEAENYWTIKFHAPGRSHDLEIILRLLAPGKKTPAELNGELKARIAELEGLAMAGSLLRGCEQVKATCEACPECYA